MKVFIRQQVYYCHVYSGWIGFPEAPRGSLTSGLLYSHYIFISSLSRKQQRWVYSTLQRRKMPPANQCRAQSHMTVNNSQSSSAHANELRDECKCRRPRPISLTTGEQDYVTLFKTPNRIISHADI